MKDDLIRRSNVIQVFNELLKSPYASNKDSRDALKLARGVFQDDVPKWLSIPTVDAVEVVRCGECKHRDKCFKGIEGMYDSDWWCADGQRREDGDNNG